MHLQFYSRIPESLWQITDVQGGVVGTVAPGAWHTRAVRVGQHVPPPAEDLPALMSAFCDTFTPGATAATASCWPSWLRIIGWSGSTLSWMATGASGAC